VALRKRRRGSEKDFEPILASIAAWLFVIVAIAVAIFD
jgi:hypothetical protein